MSLNFLTLYGSVRTERQGIKFARFLDTQLRKRGHASTLIDPLQYRVPLLDKMYKEYPKGEAPEPLDAMAGLIREADGFLVVSGEYNHGIPPALKNMLDHFLEEWFWRPSAIACYSAGAFGGVRAAMQLRATAVVPQHNRFVNQRSRASRLHVTATLRVPNSSRSLAMFAAIRCVSPRSSTRACRAWMALYGCTHPVKAAGKVGSAAA
jgi:NAD(P)H-dependent FMN reductase